MHLCHLRYSDFAECKILVRIVKSFCLGVIKNTARFEPRQKAYPNGYYRPRSEASEGYVFTGICHSVTEWGGGGDTKFIMG